MGELQQILLRDDQTIKNLRNLDPLDLARAARATASAVYQNARPEHVLDGFVRDPVPGQFQHRWAAPLAADGAWIELTWDKPQSLGAIQLTFDSGFQRELTLTASDSINKGIVRAPQPETVRDYTILYRKTEQGPLTELLPVSGNHQRINRHRLIDAIQAQSLRIHVRATNGDPLARIFEVRCYA